MSYQALVCRISHLRPIDGADRIRLATVGSYSVIVGLDVREGDLGVFFETDGQLSLRYCEENNLLRKRDPETGEQTGGYFEENRRVRAIKLKGVKSEGYWAPLSSLAYTGCDLSLLDEGDQFDHLDGEEICCKYITPATRRRRGECRPSRGATVMFPKHVETDQLRRLGGMIPKGAVIYITEKTHGTSLRVGHVLDDLPIPRRPFSAFFARLFRLPTHHRSWTYLNGSRNVVIEKSAGDGWYGTNLFRLKATEGIRLQKGEILFGELVGFTDTGQPIMCPHDTAVLKDKKAEARFGKQVLYRYGCADGECRLLVYRIAMVNEDGYLVDLSHPQMVARCRELGLAPVPLLDCFVYDGDLEGLLQRIDRMINGESGTDALPSTIDPSHPIEGVIVRVESDATTHVHFYKEKSWTFKLLEGIAKEKDVVDIEEAA